MTFILFLICGIANWFAWYRADRNARIAGRIYGTLLFAGLSYVSVLSPATALITFMVAVLLGLYWTFSKSSQ